MLFEESLSNKQTSRDSKSIKDQMQSFISCVMSWLFKYCLKEKYEMITMVLYSVQFKE